MVDDVMDWLVVMVAFSDWLIDRLVDQPIAR